MKTKLSWLVIAAIVLVTVILCGLLSRLTNGFTDFDPDSMFSQKLNEDNFFYEKLENGSFYEDANIAVVANNGILSMEGKIADTDPETVDVAKTLSLGTITIEPGTYTFTCFSEDKPTWKTYYATGTYAVDGVLYTWYADMNEAPNNSAKDETKLGKTVTLDEQTVVTFHINLCEGVNLKGVSAIPVLVEGEKDGKYSNGIIG